MLLFILVAASLSAYLRENACSGVVGLNDDMLIELGCVHAQRRVESIPLVVIQVHCDIHRQAEELAPLSRLPVIDHCWLCLQNSCKEVTMPAGHVKEI